MRQEQLNRKSTLGAAQLPDYHFVEFTKKDNKWLGLVKTKLGEKYGSKTHVETFSFFHPLAFMHRRNRPFITTRVEPLKSGWILTCTALGTLEALSIFPLRKGQWFWCFCKSRKCQQFLGTNNRDLKINRGEKKTFLIKFEIENQQNFGNYLMFLSSRWLTI